MQPHTETAFAQANCRTFFPSLAPKKVHPVPFRVNACVGFLPSTSHAPPAGAPFLNSSFSITRIESFLVCSIYFSSSSMVEEGSFLSIKDLFCTSSGVYLMGGKPHLLAWALLVCYTCGLSSWWPRNCLKHVQNVEQKWFRVMSIHVFCA